MPASFNLLPRPNRSRRLLYRSLHYVVIIPVVCHEVNVKSSPRAARRGPYPASRAGADAGADRRRRQGDASRQRILRATFELAQEFGYQGTSISKVVERSGLPASSVYWHFADKDALFSAMIQHSFDQWLATMPKWDPPGRGKRRRDEIATRIRSAIASIADSPDFWRLGLLLSLERQPNEMQARKLFKEIRRQVIANLASFWRHVLPAGYEHRAPGTPELLSRFTMATADGLFVSVQIDGDYDYGRLADLLADMLEAAAMRLTE
jgi:AcrR family transcriptional regulator